MKKAIVLPATANQKVVSIQEKPAVKQKVFCPVAMKESSCEIASGEFCNKNLSDKIECARHFETQSIYHLIPENSFLYDFVNYCNKITDAPDVFCFGAGLIVISTILQKNTYMKWAGRNLYPNLYLLLIASSGGRKSTVLNIAKSLLKRFDTTENSLIYPSDITPEAFYYLAQIKENGTFFHSEFGAFLKGLDRAYNKGFKEFLTDVYDGFSQEKVIKGPNGGGQKYRINEPVINILASSTLAWIAGNIKESDRQSGFMQRFNILYCGQDKREIALPTAAVPTDSLLEKLKELAENSGEIKLSVGAVEIYNSFFYSAAETEKRKSETYGSYQTRLYTGIIKNSMLYAVLRGGQVIEKPDMANAIELKLIFEKNLFEVYERLIEKDETHKKIDKLLNIIVEAGGEIQRSKLLKNCNLSKFDFDRIIETLIARENIISFSKPTTPKATTFYKLL